MALAYRQRHVVSDHHDIANIESCLTGLISRYRLSMFSRMRDLMPNNKLR
jgi:hypothetical protein